VCGGFLLELILEPCSAVGVVIHVLLMLSLSSLKEALGLALSVDRVGIVFLLDVVLELVRQVAPLVVRNIVPIISIFKGSAVRGDNDLLLEIAPIQVVLLSFLLLNWPTVLLAHQELPLAQHGGEGLFSQGWHARPLLVLGVTSLTIISIAISSLSDVALPLLANLAAEGGFIIILVSQPIGN